MTTTTHTPGPWVVYDNRGRLSGSLCVATRDDGGRTCAAVCSDTSTGAFYPEDEEELLANATLIAAAPELLEALKAVMDADANGDSLSHMERMRAEKAIAKAEGRA